MGRSNSGTARGLRAAVMAPDRDRGRITILILGLVVILLGVVAVTASASYVTTSHRKLLGLADSAAESAADSFTIAGSGAAPTPGKGAPKTQSGAGLVVPQKAARAAVEDYLRRIGAAQQFPGLTIRSVSVADDGVTVRVTLAARVDLPLTGGLLAPSLTVVAESNARAGLSR